MYTDKHEKSSTFDFDNPIIFINPQKKKWTEKVTKFKKGTKISSYLAVFFVLATAAFLIAAIVFLSLGFLLPVTTPVMIGLAIGFFATSAIPGLLLLSATISSFSFYRRQKKVEKEATESIEKNPDQKLKKVKSTDQKLRKNSEEDKNLKNKNPNQKTKDCDSDDNNADYAAKVRNKLFEK